eukprot:1814319-Amphidinium_carterae.1
MQEQRESNETPRKEKIQHRRSTQIRRRTRESTTPLKEENAPYQYRSRRTGNKSCGTEKRNNPLVDSVS